MSISLFYLSKTGPSLVFAYNQNDNFLVGTNSNCKCVYFCNALDNLNNLGGVPVYINKCIHHEKHGKLTAIPNTGAVRSNISM